jgi:hypothetical protein
VEELEVSKKIDETSEEIKEIDLGYVDEEDSQKKKDEERGQLGISAATVIKFFSQF